MANSCAPSVQAWLAGMPRTVDRSLAPSANLSFLPRADCSAAEVVADAAKGGELLTDELAYTVFSSALCDERL